MSALDRLARRVIVCCTVSLLHFHAGVLGGKESLGLAKLMTQKNKEAKEDPQTAKSIFDDRRSGEYRDKHIVVAERRQSRFDDKSAWYLKASIPFEVEPSDDSTEKQGS